MAAVILAGVALGKIIIAIGRGRTNFSFLIIVTIVAVVIAGKLSFPRLTAGEKQC